MTEPGAAIRRAFDLAWVDQDDRIAIMRLASLGQSVIVLTGVAAIIWRALDEVDTRAALMGLLLSEYEAGRSEIESDVDAWLVSAEREGILVRSSSGDGGPTAGPHDGRAIHDVDSE